MFKTTLKKMSFFSALLIAFMLSLACPQAAMANADTGWTADAKKYELSAIYAESVNFRADRQKSGATDTVLGVYSVLPVLPDGDGYFKSSNSQPIMRHGGKKHHSVYKDRPGWRL